MKRILLILACAMFLSGCYTTFIVVEQPGPRVQAQPVYRVYSMYELYYVPYTYRSYARPVVREQREQRVREHGTTRGSRQRTERRR